MSNIRILALSDFHGKINPILSLTKSNSFFDIAITCGDYMLSSEDTRQLFNLLNSLSKRVLAIPGNMDNTEMIKLLEEFGISLHDRRIIINNIEFIGFGGSNPGPFNTPLEYTEKVLETSLMKLLNPIPKKTWILVTHAPPYGTKIDRTRWRTHVGSKSIRKVILEYQPLIAISGHIHESAGRDHLGESVVINPGPIYNNNAVEIIIQEKEKPIVRSFKIG
jgi:Icc-related predicted phosphoesterase